MATKILIIIGFAMLVICPILSEAAVKYTICGTNNKGNVTNVEMIPECGTVCHLPRGENVTMKITFTSGEVANKLKAVVHGELGGVPIPFPLPGPNACENSGLTCPLDDGTEYTYEKALPILNEYPKVYVVIKYELKDENGADLFCVKIPSQIT